MRTYNPPHEPDDQEKLQNMIDTLESDGKLPPIVVCGETALTGSHRLRAWYKCDLDPVVVEITDEDYCVAMRSLGLDPVTDDYVHCEELCEALYDTVGDPEIKAALKDQRGKE